MKISIIIPTFNSSETIQDTINSIVSQNFKNYEIIVVDKNSKDKTIEIIKKNRLIDIKFIIENDNGIYDAINKGIKLSNGKIISLLHSDDVYYDNKVLDNVVKAFTTYDWKNSQWQCVRPHFIFSYPLIKIGGSYED